MTDTGLVRNPRTSLPPSGPTHQPPGSGRRTPRRRVAARAMSRGGTSRGGMSRRAVSARQLGRRAVRGLLLVGLAGGAWLLWASPASAGPVHADVSRATPSVSSAGAVHSGLAGGGAGSGRAVRLSYPTSQARLAGARSAGARRIAGLVDSVDRDDSVPRVAHGAAPVHPGSIGSGARGTRTLGDSARVREVGIAAPPVTTGGVGEPTTRQPVRRVRRVHRSGYRPVGDRAGPAGGVRTDQLV
jgi:hypothetical protein